jgi:hypothetical protein
LTSPTREKALGEVPDQAPAGHVVLLRHQPDVVAQSEQALIEPHGLLVPPRE